MTKMEAGMGEEKKSYYKIKTLVAGLDIINFLADQKQPITASEVAKACGLPYNSTLNYLETMVDEDWVEHAPNGAPGYQLAIGAALVWARHKNLLEDQRADVTGKLAELGLA